MALEILDVPREFRVTKLIAGNRVQLGEEGRSVLRLSNRDRRGTVVKVARDGRHVWVLWDGLKSPQLVFDAYLQRVSLWAYVHDGDR